MKPMANVNGKVTPLEEAQISILDRGFLYGDSVYEVFRTYDGIPLLCDEHFERMRHSAELAHMRRLPEQAAMLDQMRTTIRAADVAVGQDVYVRWHVTRGAGALDLIPAEDLEPTFVIIVKPVPQWNPEFFARGMTLAITSVRRNAIDALSPDMKSGNYLNNILGVTEAIELGADDCLMLNYAGEVTEASNSNVFFVVRDQLVTPDASSGILRGITKAAVVRAAASEGLEVSQRKIPVTDLALATECFVTSATREVMPVVRLRLDDGTWQEFPEGGGPLTRRAAAAYKRAVAAYVAEHQHFRLL